MSPREKQALLDGLLRHAPADDDEARDLEEICEFVRRHENPFDRTIPEGHLTGSAIIVSSTGEGTLLLHHRKLGRWLQPGGHADPGEATGEAVALREALEETGLAELVLHPRAPRPLDVDVHDIPGRGHEAAHEHLDLRYLVLAPAGARPSPALAEMRELRFFAWEETRDLGLDEGLLRALGKARAILAA